MLRHLLRSVSCLFFLQPVLRAETAQEYLASVKCTFRETASVVTSVSASQGKERLSIDDAIMQRIVELCPNLKQLNCGGAAITEVGMEQVGKLSSLENLTLSGPNLTDAGMVHIGKLTKLRQLQFHGENVTDAGVAHLAALSKLEDLILGGAITAEWGVALEGKLPELKHLTVSGAKNDENGRIHFLFPRQSGEAFRYMPSFPKLESINRGMHHMYWFNNEALRYLGQCPQHKVLLISGAVWGDKEQPDMTSLLNCKELTRYVNFHSSVFNDPTCKVLAQLPEVNNVLLESVTDAGVAELIKIPKLQSLDLSAACITPEAFRSLAACKQLRFIKIGGTFTYAIGPEDVAALQAALPQAKIQLADPMTREDFDQRRQKFLDVDGRRPYLASYRVAVERYVAAYPFPKSK